MIKSKLIDGEPIDDDQPESSSLYLLALLLKEVAIKQEDFNQVREQSWRQTTIDEMLALILASSIAGNREDGVAGLSKKDFRGLCNTVKYLYDFKHARFDGECYWFSPDKKIFDRLKKASRK